MEAFEQLEVWKRSSRLCVAVYRAFGTCRDYGFKDQVGRAALSIPSNIAEGYERNSSKEFARFLSIAKGSCAELRTQLYIGAEIGLLEHAQAAKFVEETGEISRMLQGLIGKINDRVTKGKTEIR